MRYVPPTFWDKPRFCDVAKVITGSTPPTSDLTNYGGDLPFITPAELDANEPITRASTTLSTTGASKARVLPKDAVLICCIGSLGKVGITGSKAAFNQQINALVFDKTRVDPRYGYHYCRTLKPILEHMAPSTTIAIVNKGRFQELKIPLPPMEEQRRIAAILDKADAVRRKRQEAIALTEELLRSAFLEMFGDPVANSKGWEVIELGNLLTFLTSGSRGWAKFYAPEGRLFLRIQNVKDGKLLLDDIAYVDPPNSAEASRTLVKEGDVLVSITADLGRTAVIPKGLKPAHINQHLALLRLKRERISPFYLAAFLASIGGQLQFARLNREGVKAGLNFDNLKSLHILLPSLETQMKYDSFFINQTSTLNRYQQGFDAAQSLFNSLLQRAFRGEL